MKKDIKIYIDSIDSNTIQGWFINTPSPDKNKVFLYLDGQYKAVTLADHERHDVAEAHGQVHSGFCFDIKKFPIFQHLELRSEERDVLLNLNVKQSEGRKSEKQPLELTSPYSQERHKQLDYIKIDLSKLINGDNWYHAEPAGRWGGPELESTLNIPALIAGNYSLELDITHDFCGLEAMTVMFNNNPVHFSNTQYQAPVILQAEVKTEELLFWRLSFNYPKTCLPEGESGADQRRLGIYLRAVTLTKISS
jgi:hypothetical protein